MRCRAALAAGWVVCLAIVSAAGPQQQQQPTFRTGVEIFHLDVSVLDRDRRPVRGLTAADFTILEDSRPQKIVALSAVDLPPALPPPAAWVRDVTPDVTSNQIDGRRLFVMVLDDACVSTSLAALKSVRQIAHSIVDQLGANDLMAVVFTADNRRPQNFTNDRAKLRAAIERFTRLGGLTVDNRVLMSVDTLVSASEFLIEVPERRKALVYIGTGVPINVDEASAPAMISLQTSMAGREMSIRAFERLKAIFPATERANVNIYSFDAAGLRVAPIVGNPSVEFMQVIAANTGGRAVINTNEFTAGVRQMFVENESYYVVGYESAAAGKGPGHWRKLEVKVNRPGVDVRARTRHYTEEPPPPRRGQRVEVVASGTTKALAGLLPKADLPLRVTLAPFAIPGRTDLATVAAVLALEPGPAHASALGAIRDLDLEVSAFDPEGRPRGTRTYEVRVPLDDAGDRTLAEVVSRVDLKPGAYELRLALVDAPTGTSGSVYADVEVPDFAKAPVSLSGVLVTSRPSPPSAPREALSSLVPIQPTARRSFTTADQVSAFVRIYQGGNVRTPLRPVDFDLRVTDVQERVVFAQAEAVAPDRFLSGRAADVRIDLPLARMRPGPHLLTIDVRAGDRATARRQVQFEVR